MRPQTQITGRMGELVAELELLKRGWWVTNFNNATTNFIGWDLFAAKENRSIKIRIKAKRAGETMFRWSAKSNQCVLPNLRFDDREDFVFAVSFDESPKGHEIYIIPSTVLETELKNNHAAWIAGTKKNGDLRKNTNIRTIYMDDRSDSISRGYSTKWKKYLEKWNLLE